MRLQTIVALTDFSTAAEHALDRAALLAAEHKARLHLLFGAEQPDPKFVDPQARLAQRARQLARRHGSESADTKQKMARANWRAATTCRARPWRTAAPAWWMRSCARPRAPTCWCWTSARTRAWSSCGAVAR